MKKICCFLIIFLVNGFSFCQNSSKNEGNSSLGANLTRYQNTDNETAKVLAEFEKRSDVMLCIGIFSRIPQKYISEKVNPMKEIVSQSSKFGNYVDKYIFNAMSSCLKKTKTVKIEIVKFSFKYFFRSTKISDYYSKRIFGRPQWKNIMNGTIMCFWPRVRN